MKLTNRQKSHMAFAAWLIVGILWLLSRVYLWNAAGAYLPMSRELCTFLGLRSDLEWRRFTSVTRYLQGLPQVVLGYFLLVRFPGKTNRSQLLRFALWAAAAILSMVAFPPLARVVFPSYRNPLSPNSDFYIYTVSAIFILGIVLLAAGLITLLCRFRMPKGKQWIRIGVRWGIVPVIAFLVAVAYGLILGIISHFAPDAVRSVLQSFRPDAKLISGLITMCVMAPLAEELAFRGLFLTKLRRYGNTWVAVIISSAMFALWHRNLGQLFPTFCMGMIFAWVYLRTGKLRHAVVLHSISNYFTIQSLARQSDILPHIPAIYNLREWLMELPLFWGVALLVLVIGVIVLIISKVLPRFCHPFET